MTLLEMWGGSSTLLPPLQYHSERGILRFKGSPTGSPITHLLLGEAQTLCPPMQAKWEDLFAQTNANSLPCLFLSSSPSCCIAPDW